MGRKGSWISAIKRVFSPSSKEKSTDGQEKKTTLEKKKVRGILKAGESKSFIPLFREPSSIEKILGEVDEERTFRPHISSEPEKPTTVLPYKPTSPSIISPGAASPPQASSSSMPSLPRVASPRISPPINTYQKLASPKVASPRVSPPRNTHPKVASPMTTHTRKEVFHRPEPTSRDLQLSATKIQAAYRGYVSRRSFRALRGLVRLQGVVRGQNVQRQTVNAMKQMQLLVRVQTQIHSRRTQMLENQALQRQSNKNEREMESTMSKWTYNQMVDCNSEEWDDTVLTKEAREERLRKRVEAVIKRERAMSYAYSHQLWKPQPKSAQATLGGFPWWSNWFEDHRPPSTASERTPMKSIPLTPQRPITEQKVSPCLQTSSYTHHSNAHDNHEQLTPRSTRSSMPTRGKQLLETPSRTPTSSSLKKHPRLRGSATNSRFDVASRDNDSLTSCPPFSVPNYMQPTVSAKARVRANSNPKERVLRTPGNDSKRRFSFPLTPNIGPFKWSRGYSKDPSSQTVMEKHQSAQSVDDRTSIGSAVSMPAVVGRKAFNRFV